MAAVYVSLDYGSLEYLVVLSKFVEEKLRNYITFNPKFNMQIIQDSKGRETGVFIPMKDWKVLKQKFKGLDSEVETLSPKEKVLNDIKEALQELKLIEQGKAKGRPVEELIDEL